MAARPRRGAAEANPFAPPPAIETAVEEAPQAPTAEPEVATEAVTDLTTTPPEVPNGPAAAGTANEDELVEEVRGV